MSKNTLSKFDIDEHKRFKWWWFDIQFDTEKKALDWKISSKPSYYYACWRAYKMSSTDKYHVHCMVYYKSLQRFSDMNKKGFSKLEHLTTDERKVTLRNDFLSDNQPGKDTVGEFIEVGEPPKSCLESSIRKTQVYYNVIDPSVSYDKAIESIIQHSPRDYLLHHDQIEAGLRKIKKLKKDD